MTSKPEPQQLQGTVVVVWHEDDGFIHVDPNTNAHEEAAWRHAISEAWDAIDYHGPFAEVCGYIERVKTDAPWISMRVVSVVNTLLMDADGEFAFTDEDTMRVYDLMEKGDCLGIWHSHPSGGPHPSDTDWLGHPRDPNVPMFILALDQDHPRTASVTRYEETDRP
jgi:proteasome lid subunit RPN8/RPN11